MRNRIAGLLMAFAVAAGVVATGATPAMADSTKVVDVHFFNNGWYYAYADIEGFNAAGARTYSDYSGTFGHTGHRTFYVPADVAVVHWKVRFDPTGGTIHEQWLGWDNFNDRCPSGTHATIYVGGLATNTDDYDLHCSKWG